MMMLYDFLIQYGRACRAPYVFFCRRLHSSRQILRCWSKALRVVGTIFPSPDSQRISFLPSLYQGFVYQDFVGQRSDEFAVFLRIKFLKREWAKHGGTPG
jgi:hypothetical protein